MSEPYQFWSGKIGEMVIHAVRGVPRRSNLEMEQTVARQAEAYLPHFTTLRVDPVVIALAVQLIAADHITPVSKRHETVLLSREELIGYVRDAVSRIHHLKESGDAEAGQ